MSAQDRARVQRGIPTGGQFSAESRSEVDVDLGAAATVTADPVADKIGAIATSEIDAIEDADYEYGDWHREADRVRVDTYRRIADMADSATDGSALLSQMSARADALYRSGDFNSATRYGCFADVLREVDPDWMESGERELLAEAGLDVDTYRTSWGTNPRGAAVFHVAGIEPSDGHGQDNWIGGQLRSVRTRAEARLSEIQDMLDLVSEDDRAELDRMFEGGFDESDGNELRHESEDLELLLSDLDDEMVRLGDRAHRVVHRRAGVGVTARSERQRQAAKVADLVSGAVVYTGADWDESQRRLARLGAYRRRVVRSGSSRMYDDPSEPF